MIKANEAIRTARGLIGTPYSELDCINLIKKVIRTAPGGDKNYTTAGTNALWDSYDKTGKYRDLIWRQAGISGAKPGMLAFMGVGTGDVDHVGLVTERGTVLHSSKSRGEAVETELTEKRGWNGLGKHRLIAVDDGEKEDENTMSDHAFGNATVNVTSGYLNLREGASTRGKVIGTLEIGQRVNVIREAGSGWVFLKTESGEAGYAAKEYLLEDAQRDDDPGEKETPGENGEDETEGDWDDDGELFATTTLKSESGQFVTLMGKWTIAED